MPARRTTRTTQPTNEVLTLDYELAELPSSQHRAGLAGLVLMVDWLKRLETNKGVCEIIRRDQNGATLRINRQGLEALFDELYAASSEEKAEPKLRTKKNTNQVIKPIREEIRQEVNPKTGKAQEKTFYPATVPKGAFLLDLDPSADGQNGLWVRLWRDVVWRIFRGVPATRIPFENRADGIKSSDAADAWAELTQPLHYTVDLPSTYFIGAQANNAENVPFKDRARYQFLLHFWPYAAQIYRPAIIDNEGKRDFVGYALAVPDVADLKLFCEELPTVLRHSRSAESSGFLPRDCIVDLAVEGALDILRRLRDRLTAREGEAATSNLVMGVDVLHVEKQGNNVRLLGSARLEPEAAMIDEYAQIRGALWNPLFRRQRLLNLIGGREWHAGFDRLLSTEPHEQTIGNNYFRHDARESFSNEVETMSEQSHASAEELEPNGDGSAEGLSLETLVYRAVNNYLRFKLDAKYGLAWRAVQGKPQEEGKYRETKAKLARDAFLAVRSRTGQDFVEYFVSTLCSVSQSMNEDRFIALTQALVRDTDRVRTLTMLALAAQTPSPQKTVPQS